jgi:hypothetical protein
MMSVDSPCNYVFVPIYVGIKEWKEIKYHTINILSYILWKLSEV